MSLKEILAQKGKKASKSKENSGVLSEVAALFSKPKPAKPAEPEVEEELPKTTKRKQTEEKVDEDSEAKEEETKGDGLQESLDSRGDRTIFVGNVHISATPKEIQKLFRQYGKIEKVWFRSVPVEREDGLPIRAAVILQKYKKENDAKHCYVCFATAEEAQAALAANGAVFKDLHIRVNFANKKEQDFESTVFVGNLPFNITEEQFRIHFEKCGDIKNVRLIRDPQTHQGKGIGYIYFADIPAFKNALKLNNSLIADRKIRVKKAVRPERLAKKEKQREKVRAERSASRGGKSNLQKRRKSADGPAPKKQPKLGKEGKEPKNDGKGKSKKQA